VHTSACGYFVSRDIYLFTVVGLHRFLSLVQCTLAFLKLFQPSCSNWLLKLRFQLQSRFQATLIFFTPILKITFLLCKTPNDRIYFLNYRYLRPVLGNELQCHVTGQLPELLRTFALPHLQHPSQTHHFRSTMASHEATPSHTTCSVCLEAAHNTYLPCQHSVLCEECARSVLAGNYPRCPVCRSDFSYFFVHKAFIAQTVWYNPTIEVLDQAKVIFFLIF
jgi:hypothetical protein